MKDMKRWIERCSRLKDAEGHVDELAHHGAEDDHGGLAGGGQTVSECAPPRGLRGGDHGGHVERLAQQSMAHLGETRFPLHTASRFMLTRVEAREGGGPP